MGKRERRILFPWELYVSANLRYIPDGRPGRSGITSSREYRAKKEAARLFAQQATSGAPWKGSVGIEERFWEPDRRHRDIRNIGKLFEDALEGVVYEDDVQVDELVMRRMGLDRDEPRIELVVTLF